MDTKEKDSGTEQEIQKRLWELEHLKMTVPADAKTPEQMLQAIKGKLSKNT